MLLQVGGRSINQTIQVSQKLEKVEALSPLELTKVQNASGTLDLDFQKPSLEFPPAEM